jgi:hypothetical protein
MRLLRVITDITGQRERRRGLREEEGIDADMWAHAVSEMREGEGYRFGIVSCWAVGGFLLSGRGGSPRPFSIFFSFLLFSFFCFLICFIYFA